MLGIAFGFDAINGERSERTLPRLIAQPIHRDAVIIGKFVSGLALMGLVLGAVTLLAAGVAFFSLGVTVGPDEIARLIAWFVVALAYLGFWLAFAMLCSVVVRRAATSALAAIALWIVLTLFAALLVGIVANFLAPVPATATTDQQIANAELSSDLQRISPGTLYAEASQYLLDPTVQSVDVGALVAQQSNDRAIPSVLPLDQSLLLALAPGRGAHCPERRLLRVGLRRVHAPGGQSLAAPCADFGVPGSPTEPGRCLIGARGRWFPQIDKRHFSDTSPG